MIGSRKTVGKIVASAVFLLQRHGPCCTQVCRFTGPCLSSRLCVGCLWFTQVNINRNNEWSGNSPWLCPFATTATEQLVVCVCCKETTSCLGDAVAVPATGNSTVLCALCACSGRRGLAAEWVEESG